MRVTVERTRADLVQSVGARSARICEQPNRADLPLWYALRAGIAAMRFGRRGASCSKLDCRHTTQNSLPSGSCNSTE
jgi:hypothetical protein